MSMLSKKSVVVAITAILSVSSAGAFAKDRYDNSYSHGDDRYDSRHDSRYDDRYDNRNDRDRDGYDYAKVIDVEPLMTRVRVSTPQRACWDESRVDNGGYGNGSRSNAGGAIIGAVIGGVLGHQIGSGRGRDAATAAGAVIGAGIGHQQAQRRNGGNLPPSREYTVERCETRYQDSWEERIDGYRVTYVYNGRRQVTQLPYKPGDTIRVRVDVSPAE